jgi:Flp pilus assembly protein TadG
MQFSFLATCRRTLQAFRSARQGNVSVMFAFAMIPLIGLVGAAVDYSRANAAKTAMQSALDSATLMLSKEAATLTDDQRQQKANDYFRALINNRPDLQNIEVKTPVYGNATGSSLTITVTASVKSDFMGIVGISQMNLSSSSTVKWGNTRLRVALALDNTGSMNDNGKIGALKTATHGLLKSLKNAATRDGDVYVSIVPFSRDVNVKYDNTVTSATWIKWDDGTDSSWDGSHGSCSAGSYSPRSSCTSRGTCSSSGYNNNQSGCSTAGTCSNSGYDNNQSGCSTAGTCTGASGTTQSTCGNCSISGNNDQSSCTSAGQCSIAGRTSQNRCGTCSVSGNNSKSSCQNAHGTWTPATWTTGVWTPATWTPATWTQATWTPATWTPNRSTWNGCVTDRDQSYDTDNTTPIAGDTSNPSTLFVPEQYSDCPVPLLPMTYNWDTLNTKVDAMTPDGNTNQTIGLQWAWQSLTSTDPLNAPAIDTSDGIPTKKIVILLTDGLNTQNRWSNNQTSIDLRTAAACDNIKGADVVVYSVQVNVNSKDPTSTMLQNCASPEDIEPKGIKWFMLTSADQTVATFNQIGTSLSKLRLAQ